MFRIELQPFDSGRIAGRVGLVRLEDPTAPEPRLAPKILAAGRREGYDLLVLDTPATATLEGFEPRGALAVLSARLSAIAEGLATAPARTDVSSVGGGDWLAVGELLRWAGPTRFSNDPRLPAQVVREHKLAMLRAHAKRSPENTLLARGGDGQAVGLQSCYVGGEGAVLYEIIVAPAHRGGFVAIDMLAENVRRLLDGAGDGPVSTRIYTDNAASIRLFERIGMRRTGREHHYYHAWL